MTSTLVSAAGGIHLDEGRTTILPRTRDHALMNLGNKR